MDGVYELVREYLDRCRHAREAEGTNEPTGIPEDESCVCVAVFGGSDDQDAAGDPLADQRKLKEEGP
jgi:hypothetical protein